MTQSEAFNTCDDWRDPVAGVMRKRWEHRRLRMIFAMPTASALGVLTSPAWAFAWAGLFLAVQYSECAIFNGGSADRSKAKSALTLIALSNLVFAIAAAPEMLFGGTIGAAAGVLLLAGVLVHAVMIGSRSLWTMVAAAIGPASIFVAAPLLMLLSGLAVRDTLVLWLAGLALMLAVRSSYRRLASQIAELDVARRQAEEANASKGRLLHMVSHEVRTPLNGILGMATALRAGLVNPAQLEQLDIMIQSGWSLSQLVSNVVDLADNDRPGEAKAFSAATVLEDAIEGARKCGAAMSITPLGQQGADWRIGDAALLRRAVSSILSDASRTSSPAGVAVFVEGDDEQLSISLFYRAPVLEAGWTTGNDAADRQRAATLQPVATAIRAAGGELATLPDNDGEAAGLRLSLPFARAVAPTDGRLASPAEQAEEADEAPLRILAADDHPVNRQVLALHLARLGMEAEFVENGVEAVEACRSRDYDIVLMDIQMPLMDGLSATQQILSEHARDRRIPPRVVAVTANAMDSQRDAYLGAGMVAVVAKPIAVDQLERAITLAAQPVEIPRDRMSA